MGERMYWGERNPQQKGQLAFMFSDVVGKEKKRGGAKIAEYLKKAKLGRVTATPIWNNYNTGNPVVIWVFIPYKKVFDSFLSTKL